MLPTCGDRASSARPVCETTDTRGRSRAKRFPTLDGVINLAIAPSRYDARIRAIVALVEPRELPRLRPAPLCSLTRFDWAQGSFADRRDLAGDAVRFRTTVASAERYIRELNHDGWPLRQGPDDVDRLYCGGPGGFDPRRQFLETIWHASPLFRKMVSHARECVRHGARRPELAKLPLPEAHAKKADGYFSPLGIVRQSYLWTLLHQAVEILPGAPEALLEPAYTLHSAMRYLAQCDQEVADGTSSSRSASAPAIGHDTAEDLLAAKPAARSHRRDVRNEFDDFALRNRGPRIYLTERILYEAGIEEDGQPVLECLSFARVAERPGRRTREIDPYSIQDAMPRARRWALAENRYLDALLPDAKMSAAGTILGVPAQERLAIRQARQLSEWLRRTPSRPRSTQEVTHALSGLMAPGKPPAALFRFVTQCEWFRQLASRWLDRRERPRLVIGTDEMYAVGENGVFRVSAARRLASGLLALFLSEPLASCTASQGCVPAPRSLATCLENQLLRQIGIEVHRRIGESVHTDAALITPHLTALRRAADDEMHWIRHYLSGWCALSRHA